MIEAAALRAAAQAVAAISHGAELHCLTLDGVEIKGAAAGAADIPGDIAVWVAGVAALDRRRHGTPAGTGWTIDFDYSEDQRHDLAEAARLAAEADPQGDRDLLYAAWVWATDLMADEAAWMAIEGFARLIEKADSKRASEPK